MSDQPEIYHPASGFAFEYAVLCACCEQPMDKHETEYFTDNEYLVHASVTETREYTNMALQALRDSAAFVKLDGAALALAKALHRGVKLAQMVRELSNQLRDNWEE